MSEHRILILCPTRGRPAMAREMAESFLATKPEQSMLCFVVDEDDPDSHFQSLQDAIATLPVPLSLVGLKGAVWPLNCARLSALETEPHTLAFLNDDHRFITPDWEQQIIEARQKYAVVYPNDCNNNESALTIPFFDARIAKALGFIAPPCLAHLYSDDFWFHLGYALHSIKYLPDCKIDHLHPFAGKREMDATTQAVNNDNVREHDRLAFYQYMATEFPGDVEKARKAIQ